MVTRRLPDTVEEALSRDFDARLNTEDKPLGPDGLKEALRSADALLCTVTDRINAEVLSAKPRRAKILANFGVGFNHIDTQAAQEHGLAVSNTPDVLTEATADIAITLLLMVSRRTGEGERHVRSGAWTGWRPTHMLGSQVSGKVLGLIGMGRIARAAAQAGSSRLRHARHLSRSLSALTLGSGFPRRRAEKFAGAGTRGG